MHGRMTILAATATFLACTITLQAGVSIDLVTVANPGNTGEMNGSDAGGTGPGRLTGAVDYSYDIGKFEITAGQYCQFLNAVATTDSYGLYSYSMSVIHGCHITQNGQPGGYSYTVDQDWANRPVNYVSWADAVRFANWMHNGQPTGMQDSSTTEDGSYLLNGATSDAQLMAITRNENATWAIPSEDEWYKAAYHKNDGLTDSYFDFPTGSDSIPQNALNFPQNSATFYAYGYTIGHPYYRTEVGAHTNSPSPCGTFDQGGNVSEWTEAQISSTGRGISGGSYYSPEEGLRARNRYQSTPTNESNEYGFRLVLVPEPTTLLLLGAAVSLVLTRKNS